MNGRWIVWPMLALVAATGAAADTPVLTLRLESLDALRDDARALGLDETGAQGPDALLSELVAPLGLDCGDWVDPRRPVFLLASFANLMSPGAGLDAVLPVLDPQAAMEALGRQVAEDDAGVRAFEREGDSRVHAMLIGDYLVVGTQPGPVGAVDPRGLRALALPAGSVAIDFDLEALTPMIEGMLAMQQQMMRQRLEAQSQADSAEPLAGVENVAGMMDFYADSLLAMLRNTSRWQLSLERAGGHVLLHSRLLPVPGSDLEALLAAQPEGFPRIARAVSAEPALLRYAGNVRLTPAVREGLIGFADQYMSMLQQLLQTAGDSLRTPWPAGYLEAQAERVEARIVCTRGDAAGSMGFGAEGMSTVQLAGIPADDRCRDLVESEVAAAAALSGPDGQPLVRLRDGAVEHRGVRAVRVELDLRSIAGVDAGAQDEAGLAAVETLLGEDGFVTYYGRSGDVMLSTTGAGGERRFTEVVDRLLDRRGTGGLSASEFAPLEAGAGIYAVLDLSRIRNLPGLLGAAADAAGSGQAPAPLAGRIVFGARSSGDALVGDLALPVELLRSLTQKTTAESAEESGR